MYIYEFLAPNYNYMNHFGLNKLDPASELAKAFAR
jgi:hypothetical protein